MVFGEIFVVGLEVEARDESGREAVLDEEVAALKIAIEDVVRPHDVVGGEVPIDADGTGGGGDLEKGNGVALVGLDDLAFPRGRDGRARREYVGDTGGVEILLIIEILQVAVGVVVGVDGVVVECVLYERAGGVGGETLETVGVTECGGERVARRAFGAFRDVVDEAARTRLSVKCGDGAADDLDAVDGGTVGRIGAGEAIAQHGRRESAEGATVVRAGVFCPGERAGDVAELVRHFEELEIVHEFIREHLHGVGRLGELRAGAGSGGGFVGEVGGGGACGGDLELAERDDVFGLGGRRRGLGLRKRQRSECDEG